MCIRDRLEGLLQYAPNKNSFCELMLLKECTYSRMIDYYDALDFRNILVKRGAGKGAVESINLSLIHILSRELPDMPVTR